MKFPNAPDLQEQIREAEKPSIAAAIGRDRNNPLRLDWESVKDDYMRMAVLQKFSSHGDICEILLSTNNEELIEETTNDYYWGEGTHRTGKNMLGKILMDTRGVLREKIAHLDEPLNSRLPNPGVEYYMALHNRLNL